MHTSFFTTPLAMRIWHHAPSCLSSQKKCFFDQLPTELLNECFKFLKAKDLAKCSRVCKKWKKISYDPTFWHIFVSACGISVSKEFSRKIYICEFLLNSLNTQLLFSEPLFNRIQQLPLWPYPLQRELSLFQMSSYIKKDKKDYFFKAEKEGRLLLIFFTKRRENSTIIEVRSPSHVLSGKVSVFYTLYTFQTTELLLFSHVKELKEFHFVSTKRNSKEKQEALDKGRKQLCQLIYQLFYLQAESFPPFHSSILSHQHTGSQESPNGYFYP